MLFHVNSVFVAISFLNGLQTFAMEGEHFPSEFEIPQKIEVLFVIVKWHLSKHAQCWAVQWNSLPLYYLTEQWYTAASEMIYFDKLLMFMTAYLHYLP